MIRRPPRSTRTDTLFPYTTRFGACFMLLIFVRCAGRGDSAICTAPPPMIAPPQAQAHNLDKAIRTDIFDTLFVLRGDQVPPVTQPISSSADETINRNGINRDSATKLKEL